MAMQAIKYVQRVMGMGLPRPPILRMSCSWCMARITDPAPRNKQALKKAWVSRWKLPAQKAPTPTPMNM